MPAVIIAVPFKLIWPLSLPVICKIAFPVPTFKFPAMVMLEPALLTLLVKVTFPLFVVKLFPLPIVIAPLSTVKLVLLAVILTLPKVVAPVLVLLPITTLPEVMVLSAALLTLNVPAPLPTPIVSDVLLGINDTVPPEPAFTAPESATLYAVILIGAFVADNVWLAFTVTILVAPVVASVMPFVPVILLAIVILALLFKLSISPVNVPKTTLPELVI